jgi:hypothetical protein
VQVNGTAESAANALSAFMADHYQELTNARDIAQKGLDTAQKGLEAAFSREMEATRETFTVKIEELEESLSGARQRLETSSAIAEALGGALGDRLFPSVEAQRQSQDTAAAYLRSLVGMGEINDVEALQSALKAVADPSSATYTTLEAYRRDFEITSGVIRALEQKAALTLSADEQSVLLLEQQISDTQAQSDMAVDLLQQQLDALLGVNESIQTLASAMADFQAALAATKAATAAASGDSGGNVSAGLSAEQAYLANNPDVLTAVADGRFDSGADHFQNFGKGEGRDFGGGVAAGLSAEQMYLASNPDVLNAVAQGVFSSAADHFQQYGKAEGRAFGLPAFADGGAHSGGYRMVGENGPELEYTGPSQIVTSGTSKSLFDDSGMVKELRMLRDEVSELKQINMPTARSTQTSADLAEKRDQIGTDRSASGDAILVKVV